MTTYVEYVGVFVCGVLLGVAGAIQVAELLGLLVTQTAAIVEESSGSAEESEAGMEPESVRRPAAKKVRRRTPWRKVKARYEAEHRRTRQSVEERVQEMSER